MMKEFRRLSQFKNENEQIVIFGKMLLILSNASGRTNDCPMVSEKFHKAPSGSLLIKGIAKVFFPE